MKDYNEGIFEDSYFVSCVLENKFENIFRKYDIFYDGNEKKNRNKLHCWKKFVLCGCMLLLPRLCTGIECSA